MWVSIHCYVAWFVKWHYYDYEFFSGMCILKEQMFGKDGKGDTLFSFR